MNAHRLALSLLVIAILSLGFTLAAVSRSGSPADLEIFVVKADGSDRHNLTRNSAQDDHPVVSPDGRTVLFIRDRMNLMVMASNGTHIRQLLFMKHLAGPVWSHDGALVAFTSCPDLSAGDCKIGVVGRDGSGLVWISDAVNPTWSTTGRRLAFQTEFSPVYRAGAQAVAVANADGSDRRIVVRSSDLMAYRLSPPVWSPKGSTIALPVRGTAGPWPLYVVNVDSGSPARPVAPNGYDPTWSPDGRRLAFYYNGLWTVHADGSRLRRLPRIRSSNFPRFPSWSPDGTKIAFLSRPQASLNLVVMNLTKRSFRVVARGLESRQTVWSPDGRLIYFVAGA